MKIQHTQTPMTLLRSVRRGFLAAGLLALLPAGSVLAAETGIAGIVPPISAAGVQPQASTATVPVSGRGTITTSEGTAQFGIVAKPGTNDKGRHGDLRWKGS